MALIDDLKQRRFEAQTRVRNCEEQIDTYQRSFVGWTQRVNDLDICIAALEPPPAAVTEPEPEPEPQDDASEFSEEGYAPVVEPEPLADPIWNEPEPTKPEADALAKALDHYDPKAMADRDRFNPFAMFRKEGDQ